MKQDIQKVVNDFVKLENWYNSKEIKRKRKELSRLKAFLKENGGGESEQFKIEINISKADVFDLKGFSVKHSKLASQWIREQIRQSLVIIEKEND